MLSFRQVCELISLKYVSTSELASFFKYITIWSFKYKYKFIEINDSKDNEKYTLKTSYSLSNSLNQIKNKITNRINNDINNEKYNEKSNKIKTIERINIENKIIAVMKYTINEINNEKYYE